MIVIVRSSSAVIIEVPAIIILTVIAIEAALASVIDKARSMITPTGGTTTIWIRLVAIVSRRVATRRSWLVWSSAAETVGLDRRRG